jgi:2-polyprenyl-3-methyl-5-hydroxy-6-metoxy-1,4-benzoquinol methylase
VKPATRFDAAFFKRFYFDHETRVTTREEMRARAGLIAAVLRHAELPVRSILDAGCGIGMLAPAFARVLNFSALTTEDWRGNCDRSRTDSAAHMRPAAWYRTRLQRSFHHYGLGVWIRKTRSTVRWALES